MYQLGECTLLTYLRHNFLWRKYFFFSFCVYFWFGYLSFSLDPVLDHPWLKGKNVFRTFQCSKDSDERERVSVCVYVCVKVSVCVREETFIPQKWPTLSKHPWSNNCPLHTLKKIRNQFCSFKRICFI
jgi:hypothetical protein